MAAALLTLRESRAGTWGMERWTEARERYSLGRPLSSRPKRRIAAGGQVHSERGTAVGEGLVVAIRVQPAWASLRRSV
jgi:hypothetical protein